MMIKIYYHCGFMCGVNILLCVTLTSRGFKSLLINQRNWIIFSKQEQRFEGRTRNCGTKLLDWRLVSDGIPGRRLNPLLPSLLHPPRDLCPDMTQRHSYDFGMRRFLRVTSAVFDRRLRGFVRKKKRTQHIPILFQIYWLFPLLSVFRQPTLQHPSPQNHNCYVILPKILKFQFTEFTRTSDPIFNV